MKRTVFIFSLIIALSLNDAHSQHSDQDFPDGRFFIGSSAFVLVNAIPDQANPPNFYQLNVGYWLTPKDVISVEAITWKYHAPLGIPFGPNYGSSDESYTGHIREFGLGIAYQRFILKGFYSGTHATPMLQIYVNSENEKIQNGFQLFLTQRFGYHFKIKNRFFIEPSIAFTHWPINTNVPESFREVENKWPNYFLFEPGLHFGVKF
ncbi:MAG: hypothetical protein U5K72_13860 [Balneolaceae bacterium]|nr:hypothetical protein [Balneolaceae bacterium]